VKLALSFLAGVILCGLLLFGARSVLPIRAETDNLSSASDNLATSLVDFLPDIEKIYKESFTLPFVKAESKIYDDDIRDFYRELLDNTVLYEPGEESQ
jgi:hypothetical protein